MLNNDKLKIDETNAWARNTLIGYLNSLVYNISKSKFYINKILLLLIQHNSEDMQQIFDSELPRLQMWVWIFWIPQLISGCQRSLVENYIYSKILNKISLIYPQTLYIMCQY